MRSATLNGDMYKELIEHSNKSNLKTRVKVVKINIQKDIHDDIIHG